MNDSPAKPIFPFLIHWSRRAPLSVSLVAVVGTYRPRTSGHHRYPLLYYLSRVSEVGMHSDSLSLRLSHDHRLALLGYIRSFSPYSRTRREEQGQVYNLPSTCATPATRIDTSISTLVIGKLVFWSHRVHRVIVKASVLSVGRSSFFRKF